MGVVECNSNNNMFSDFEEDSNSFSHNNLDKRIRNEYLKLMGKQNLSSQLKSYQEKDEKEKMYIEINSQLNPSKKISRFKKWYNMSYEFYKTETTNIPLQKKTSNTTGGSSNSLTNNLYVGRPIQKSKSSLVTTDVNSMNSYGKQSPVKPLLSLDDVLRQTYNINIAEKGLRSFFGKNKEKLLERISKGPPESYRWVAWIVCGKLPLERNSDIYYDLLNETLSTEDDLQIKKDLRRTLSDLPQFSCKTNLDKLYRVLKAFALSDKEVAYCQGMNFIVGFMLIISDFNEVETYYMMLSLFSFTFGDNLGIRGFFIEGFPLLQLYTYQFNSLFESFLPELHKAISKVEIPNEAWVSKWFQTLFTISLPRELTARIWDCIFSYGLDFLFNITLALLKVLEPQLLKLEDTVDFAEFFKLLHANAVTNEEEKIKLDYEDLIFKAKQIHIKKTTLHKLKLEFEKNNKIDLSKLNVKYDLSKSFSSSRDSNRSNSHNSSVVSSNVNFSGISLLQSPVKNNTGSYQERIASRDNSSKFLLVKPEMPVKLVAPVKSKSETFVEAQADNLSPTENVNLVFISPSKSPSDPQNSKNAPVIKVLDLNNDKSSPNKSNLKPKNSKKNIRNIQINEPRDNIMTPSTWDMNEQDSIDSEDNNDVSSKISNHNFSYNLENTNKSYQNKSENNTPRSNNSKKELYCVKDNSNNTAFNTNVEKLNSNTILESLTKKLDSKKSNKAIGVIPKIQVNGQVVANKISIDSKKDMKIVELIKKK